MPVHESADLGAAAVFVAVAGAGSLTAAAAQLGVTRSAVSRRLSQLEARLGVRLLHRTSRALALTEAGTRYLEHASVAVEAMRQAESAATELQSEVRGRLRVLAPMAFGRAQLAPRLAPFFERYPGVRLSLSLDDRRGRLLDGDFDVALWAHPVPREAMTVRTLAHLRSVVCASPEYVAKHGAPQSPSALLEHPCLAYSYSEEAVRWTFLDGDGAQTVEVSGPVEVNNGDALCALVFRGVGIARLPTFVAAPHIEAGRLVPLLREFSMPTRPLQVVFRDREYLPQKVRVFVDYLAEILGGAPWDRN